MDLSARLKATNAAMRRRDRALDDELIALDSLEVGVPELPGGGGLEPETIVLRTGRPVLAIKRDEADLTIDDPDSEVWKSRLTTAHSHLVRAAKAVGRIEVVGHSLGWLGTGWLVAPDTIVTNRHVAAEFGRRSGTGFSFRMGLDGNPMRASIDLLEEIDRPDSLSLGLVKILHIEDGDGPDIAFLRVDQIGGESPPSPISLAENEQPEEFVAVIGYPARDSRIPELDLMDRIFGNVYDKKRLAPGQLITPANNAIRHDCSTLGGNSGSVVLSLTTGKAVGLHFAGRFLQANFAVPSGTVAQRLESVQRGRTASPVAGRASEDVLHATTTQPPSAERASTTVTYLLPVSITVDVGAPYQATSTGTPPRPSSPTLADGNPAEDDEIIVEAALEDYVDRNGYDPAFLGEALAIPLPTPTREAEVGAETERTLTYEHFTVLMNNARRLCRFSAVNIDGNQPKSFARASWRTDPRIPAGAQIKAECYGAPPKFSRGHMTRRQDPVWGADEAASRGNVDSMHVTNAVPQMQPFNAGIWLDLEDYALQNAKRDRMKISVLTGPFLDDDDPTMFGVRIPVEFWKVIVFVHDVTGELCATGYTMSQRQFFSESEFVFGAHETSQRTISSIEQHAGLSFGPLAALDPFDEPEGVAPRLTDVAQIQLIPRRR